MSKLGELAQFANSWRAREEFPEWDHSKVNRYMQLSNYASCHNLGKLIAKARFKGEDSSPFG